ncbi:hypothetical protein ACFL4C_02545 [Candidatus Omnitrophota bacterium]
MSAYKIGDIDDCGNILRRRRRPVELWETPKGNYVICLWVTGWDALRTRRKYRKDADVLFDSVCNMLPNLPPEES